MSATELIAEALWQAESKRASGAPRRETWKDQDESTKAKWCFMAAAALDALLDADYGIHPPKHKR